MGKKKYLKQGSDCAKNIERQYKSDIEGVSIEDVNYPDSACLEHRAVMLNYIFCMELAEGQESTHPVCSITLPLKEKLTEINQLIRETSQG